MRSHAHVALLFLAAGCASSSSSSSSEPTDSQETAVVRDFDDQAVARTLEYWTPERMAAVAPAHRPTLAAGAEPSSMGTKGESADVDALTLAEPTSPAEPIEPAASSPSETDFGGVPIEGALFSSDGAGDHFCSGSVVASPHKNLIITAAHCVTGRTNIAFVPKYDQGKRPFGTWAVTGFTVDARFVATRDIDLDFAFGKVAPLHGKNIENVVGANGLKINQGFINRVTVIGYPNLDQHPSDRPITCTNTTSRWRDYKYQVEFDCKGYPDGTSGSPWLLDFDRRTGRGYTNGVIGGWNEGGPNNDISTTSYFDHDIAHLYAVAQK